MGVTIYRCLKKRKIFEIYFKKPPIKKVLLKLRILSDSVGDPQEFAIADPCPYHVKYSPDVFQNKTKNLATYNTDKSCFENFYVK